jgi:uncharacterized protein
MALIIQMGEQCSYKWSALHHTSSRSIIMQMAEFSNWLERPIGQTIREALVDTPVVCVVGPRQCGKTSLVRHLAPNREFVTLDESSALQVAREDPAGFVAGLPEQITLDEVQRAPELFLAIKRAVDENRTPGRFLLTGSANLHLMPQIRDSLAGRIEMVHLQPLSETEKAGGKGDFIRRLLAREFRPEMASPEMKDAAELQRRLQAALFRGGFPEATMRSQDSRARQWHRQYLASLLEMDAPDVAKILFPKDLNRILTLLAHQNSNLLNVNGISKALEIPRQRLEVYFAVLEKLFLIRRLPAWHGNPSKRLIKRAKVSLVDSGLAATLAGLSVADWVRSRKAIGSLFESFVVQQVITQAGWTDPDLRFYHYRDKEKREVDLVIERGLQVWGIEVKLAGSVDRRDAPGLRRLKDQCGSNFAGGVLLYGGHICRELDSGGLWAVPMTHLWH